MDESNSLPSPRHSRRRSMPASFRALTQKKTSTNKEAARTVATDKLSVSTYWDDFESHILASNLQTASLKQEEVNWKIRLGLTGSSFWGYNSPAAEQCFFRYNLEQNLVLTKFFMFGLIGFLVIDSIFFAYPLYDIHPSILYTDVAALSFALVLGSLALKRRLENEKLAFVLFLLVGIVHGFQNLNYLEFYRHGRITVDFFLVHPGANLGRKRVFLMNFYLLVASSAVIGIRPFDTACMALCFAFVSETPIFLAFYSKLLEGDTISTEIFFTITGPINYMMIGACLIGLLYHRTNRLDFERRVLKFDMDRKIESIFLSTPPSLTQLASNASSQDCPQFSRNGGSASIMPIGSVDSINTMAQESIMDKRIRALQQAQLEYSVRRDPTMLVLLELGVEAIGLSMRRIRENNTNWTDFFSEQQENGREGSSPRPLEKHLLTPPGRRSKGKTLASPTRPATATPRRRRHSVNRIDVSDAATVATERIPIISLSNGTPTPSSADGLLPMVINKKRSSSIDDQQMSQASSTTTQEEFAISYDQDISLGADFDKHLRDWNFGPSKGIWTTLFSEPSSNKPIHQNPLTMISMRACTLFGLFDDDELCLDPRTCHEFFSQIETRYMPREDVPYHNALHACDVLQTVYSIICMDDVGLGNLPIFALFLSAAIHDVAHPGLNNTHLVTTQHELALTYNDTRVLENFHVSTAFAIMQSNPRFDVIKKMREAGKIENMNLFRSLVIEMVLSTDLKYHFDQQAFFSYFVSEHEKNPKRERTKDDVSLICSTLLHAADISNVAKSWDSYQPWIALLFEEFFAQGDLERTLGLEPQPMMDRTKCNPANAQTTFIVDLVMPMYQQLCALIPNTCGLAIDHMQNNVAKLRELSQQYEEEKQKQQPQQSKRD